MEKNTSTLKCKIIHNYSKYTYMCVLVIFIMRGSYLRTTDLNLNFSVNQVCMLSFSFVMVPLYRKLNYFLIESET